MRLFFDFDLIRFMNLDQNQVDVISDFVSIFSATVKYLKIDLT